MAVPPPSAPPCPPGEEFELHFIGELEFGCEFPGLSSDDGLFIDYAAEAGSDWLPIARKEGFIGQTQTTYADAEGVYVFNHPLDFHFIADSLAGWPKLHVQVFKLDAAGRVETVAYGSSMLPSMPGHAELTCRTWRPLKTSVMEEARAVSGVLGSDPGSLPAPRADILSDKVPEVRSKMVTKTSGSLCISLDTILRNANKHGVLLQHRRR
ncbi:B9D2 [Symbiodinium necroappetens]|uniref:B9 domain-containing protein 2 n=1 Tax=Symbiodinium necroappetens TaxID=1628268 RepID=A0A813CRN8_9DINO|nr:B9D2 [Symbiodinium necroappetens]